MVWGPLNKPRWAGSLEGVLGKEGAIGTERQIGDMFVGRAPRALSTPTDTLGEIASILLETWPPATQC